ncbi:MAG TPA: hypothetical protein EYG33_02615 [Candidatus Poseidoniales archaeon]|jgi:hypothetical protein|nr:hypothetical protein [Candidatus Poseidoniales archaeon]
MSVLDGIERVIADSDLDGLMAAAVLKASKPSLEIHFSHPALIRSGSIDYLIDEKTALCDLPFHPKCGLYLDHHMTNKPTPEQEELFLARGGICHWRDTPSAARAAYDLMKTELDLSHLEEVMPIVDALDSGGVSFEDFMADGPVIRLSRSLSLKDPQHLQKVMEQFAQGESLDDILESHKDRLNQLSAERANEVEAISAATKIIDGLAICDLSNSGLRTNGYLVTALAGPEAIACCVIHGFTDGSIENPQRPALGASFYANSFRDEDNPFDLSRLATLLDESGGGHANACGCRIQPPINEPRNVEQDDIIRNLNQWLNLWSQRETKLLRN